MMRAITRTLSFFSTWMAEVVRQPALMLSLVVGPFLLLLLFIFVLLLLFFHGHLFCHLLLFHYFLYDHYLHLFHKRIQHKYEPNYVKD